MKFLVIFLLCFFWVKSQNFRFDSKDVIVNYQDSSKKTIVIWGGISYANPQWMEKQIPQKISKNYNLVILSYQKDLKSTKDWFFQKYNIKLKPNILVGFSRGGIQSENELKGKYEMVCLLDPVLTGSLLDVKKHKNTIIIFNSSTWGREYSKKLMMYGKHIGRNKGTWIIEEVGHKNFPTYFFKNFF